MMFIFNFFLILSFFFNFLVFFSCDAAENYQMDIQDPATYQAEWMIDFHDLIMADLILVLCIIFFLLILTIFNSSRRDIPNTYFSHSQNLEIFWTLFPTLILLSIAYPSFNLLYSLEDFNEPVITVKVIGHQWYWSYEFFNDENDVAGFDSYICDIDDLVKGEFRLLTTDTSLIIPKEVPIKLLITSADVLHSWAVPSFGIKVDACPGRLNQAFLYIKREGYYFGQCSEICGVNHGFMPIMVKVVSLIPKDGVDLDNTFVKPEGFKERNPDFIDRALDWIFDKFLHKYPLKRENDRLAKRVVKVLHSNAPAPEKIIENSSAGLEEEVDKNLVPSCICDVNYLIKLTRENERLYRKLLEVSNRDKEIEILITTECPGSDLKKRTILRAQEDLISKEEIENICKDLNQELQKTNKAVYWAFIGGAFFLCCMSVYFFNAYK